IRVEHVDAGARQCRQYLLGPHVGHMVSPRIAEEEHLEATDPGCSRERWPLLSLRGGENTQHRARRENCYHQTNRVLHMAHPGITDYRLAAEPPAGSWDWIIYTILYRGAHRQTRSRRAAEGRRRRAPAA